MSSAGSQTLVQIGYSEWAKTQDIGADYKVIHTWLAACGLSFADPIPGTQAAALKAEAVIGCCAPVMIG